MGVRAASFSVEVGITVSNRSSLQAGKVQIGMEISRNLPKILPHHSTKSVCGVVSFLEMVYDAKTGPTRPSFGSQPGETVCNYPGRLTVTWRFRSAFSSISLSRTQESFMSKIHLGDVSPHSTSHAYLARMLLLARPYQSAGVQTAPLQRASDTSGAADGAFGISEGNPRL
jgi:hypothetical protein